MNNRSSAKYFADDLRKQMAISLSGNIEFFDAFIPDYINSYKDEVLYVIDINTKWDNSKLAMDKFISENYQYYTADAKKLLEYWIITN